VPVGITADIEGQEDIILVGAKDGVSKFDLSTGKHEYIAKFFPGKEESDEARSMRANDGAVDSSGRFWVEIFTDPTIKEPGDEGKLLRLDPDGQLRTMYENVTIPNGISWNAQDNTMFFTDCKYSLSVKTRVGLLEACLRRTPVPKRAFILAVQSLLNRYKLTMYCSASSGRLCL
jgi:sugar lactone lactonase YvrE